MAARGLSEKQMQETLNLVDQHQNVSAAAIAAGINRSTFEGRYRRSLQVLRPDQEEPPTSEPDITLPEFPDEDIDVEEILDHLSKRWEKKQEHEQAKRWFDIKVKSDDVFGLAVVGDPHLGSHCNIPLLRRDVEIMSTTPGIHCVNIGDTVNNWPGYGRLAALYAEEDMSRPTERKLARWFLEALPWVV